MVEILAFSIGPQLISWDYLGFERLAHRKARSEIMKTIHHENPIFSFTGLATVSTRNESLNPGNRKFLLKNQSCHNALNASF
jgi:hypothetical protein